MKDGQFYQISGWMGNSLELRGNDLICFAIIYGFSMDGESQFKGNLEYLTGCMFSTRPTALLSLKKLLECNLILKEEKLINGKKHCYYATNIIYNEGKFEVIDSNKEPLSMTSKESLSVTIKESLPKNNNNKEQYKNKKRLSNDNQKKDELFDKFWEEYDYKKSKKDAIQAWNKLTDAEKEIAIKAIPFYKQDCKHYQRSMQHPATYLRKRTFEDDFNIIPEYYQNDENDNSTEARYKRYMIKTFPNLIYHRNPLTFEQYMYFVEEYNESGRNYVNESLEKLNTMEINQFMSIEQGLKRLLKESKEDRVYGDE